MKNLIPVLMFILSQQAMACISVGNGAICVGDTVFKGSSYSQGAIVVGENQYAQQVTVRSKASGNLNLENIRDLDITSGCLGQVCTGDKVLKGSSYSQGAMIVGINYFNQTLTVKSVASGNLAVEQLQDLDLTRGCIDDVCVGDRVFKGSSYSLGADVVALNYGRSTLTVKSVASGNLAIENKSDLDVTKGCLGNICVNDLVFKGTSYSQGATVLAINTGSYRATVKSVASGNLASESIYDLMSNNGPRYPRDPRDQQGPQAPREPRDPRFPTPSPIPAPRQVTEQCTVNRLDPAGMFITSYNRSVTGYPGSDLKQQACRLAMSECSMNVKGRQSCNVAY
jgi:hypothetical protein